MVDEVDTLEVSIRESDRRKTSWRWFIDIVDVDVPYGMEVVLVGLARLLSVGESSRNGVDHPSYLLGGFLFLRRLSIAS